MALGRTALALGFVATLLLSAAWRSASVVEEAKDRLDSLDRAARLGHLAFATAKLDGLAAELGPALESTSGASFERPSYGLGRLLPPLARDAAEAWATLEERRERNARLLDLDRRIAAGPNTAMLLELDALDRAAPTEPWIPFLRARVQSLLGDRRAASESLAEARRRAPDSPFFQRVRE